MPTPTLSLPSSVSPVSESVTWAPASVAPEITTFTASGFMTCMITGGDPNGVFFIEYASGGTLKLKANLSPGLDFETQSSYVLTITADAMDGSAPAVGNLTITITDAGSPPEFQDTAGNSIGPANTAPYDKFVFTSVSEFATTIGTVVVLDPDNDLSSMWRPSIVDSDVSDSFDPVGQFILQDNLDGTYTLKVATGYDPLNFESLNPSDPVVRFALQARDNEGSITTVDAEIQVTDAGAPPEFQNASGTPIGPGNASPNDKFVFSSISELATTIGTFRVTDPDNDLSSMYPVTVIDSSVSDSFDPTGKFTVVDNFDGTYTLKVATGANPIDFESLNAADPVVRLGLSAQDNEGSVTSVDVEISVLNVGPSMASNYYFTAELGFPAHVIFDGVVATGLGPMTYSIDYGSGLFGDDALFQIDSLTGQLWGIDDLLFDNPLPAGTTNTGDGDPQPYEFDVIAVDTTGEGAKTRVRLDPLLPGAVLEVPAVYALTKKSLNGRAVAVGQLYLKNQWIAENPNSTFKVRIESGDPLGAFEIVKDDAHRYEIRIKDKTKINFSLPNYSLVLQPVYKTPRTNPNPGEWYKAGSPVTVTIPVIAGLANTVPQTGLGQNFESTRITWGEDQFRVTFDDGTSRPMTLGEKRVRVDELVDAALGFGTPTNLYDSSNPNSGYWINGGTIRSANGATVAAPAVNAALANSVAGFTGLAWVWNCSATRNVDNSYDFSNVRFHAIVFEAVFVEQPAVDVSHTGTVTDKLGNNVTKTVSVSGPASTATHESWHGLGAMSLVREIERKMSEGTKTPYYIDRDRWKLGIKPALDKAIVKALRQLETAAPHVTDFSDAEASAKAMTILDASLMSWKYDILVEGFWHRGPMSAYVYETSVRNALAPWNP